MGTPDISRSATDFRKHYKSVGMQQGRVTLDADFNENEDLHGEEERRALVDIIGPDGTPDDGFLISDVKVLFGKIDFAIAAGTFYLGGLHLEMDQTERFREQSDWLQFSGPALPAPPTAGRRFDLVYLESWLQPVTAVEDSELLEPALGGPDTSTRMRVMRRVWLAMNMPIGDCRQDWNTLVGIWKRNGLGALNDQNEQVADTRLQVDFEPGTTLPADLCSPPVSSGYLGAENQAIRVQLTDATHFTWGFDNAAPLYRVQVSNNGATITMLTEPKDQAHWPLSGQVVELLQWTAVLPNKEKLASQGGGFPARVASSYNPDTKSFTIATNVPATFGAGWKTRTDAADLGPEFFYLRVWNRGSDTTSPLTIPFVPGAAVSLGQTGLKVTITGTDRRPFDYWIIAARPESPNTVVPWLLKSGRSPHGVRRFYTPLAVIEWTATPGISPGVKGKVIHDCRKTFPPLTRLPKCCTYTVGDGVNSFGTFTKVQDAIDHLPAGGGEVCILPGVFEGDTVILNRRNITVHGCGRRTILRSTTGSTNAVIRIQDSQQIVIRNLAIEAPAVAGVKMMSTQAAEAKSLGLEQIDLADLEISVRNESAIDCRGGRFIRIERNKVKVAGLAEPLSIGSNSGKSAAVFVGADDVRIELNTIESVVQRRIVAAPGGLQIRGGSERVEIRRNRISGGNGNGITLGSFSYILQKNLQLLSTHYFATMLESIAAYPGAALFIDGDDCSHPDPDPPHPIDPEGVPRVPVSDGNLTDIRIIDNDILNMGLNGIATVRFSRAGQGSPISIRNLDIELNRITGCVQVDLGNSPFSDNFPYGYGGISLVACEYLTLRNNWITKNGKSHIDPICGVYIFTGGGVVIEQNEIVDNGPTITTAQRGPTLGPRGGIVIELARAPIVLSRVNPPQFHGAQIGIITTSVPHEGFPALHVSDNVVIAPMGPALQVVALGLVSVQDNQFTSLGVERFEKRMPLPTAPPTNVFIPPPAPGTVLPRLAELGGVTIRIFNAAPPGDHNFTGFRNMRLFHPGSPAALGFVRIVGGHVLFNDNQVLLSPKGRADDGLIMSSVLIISADDISKLGNQSDCGLTTGPIATNGLAMATSLRVSDNRYKEPLLSNPNNMFSAVTYGLMNTTSVNQGTHCFLVLPSPPLALLTLDLHNRSLVQGFFPELCGRDTLQAAIRFEQTPALADEMWMLALTFIAVENQRQDAALQLEQRRLDAKYGPTSVQVREGILNLAMHNQFQAGIQVLSERLNVPTPEPSENRFVVYGRILNDEGCGRAGLSVSVESQDAKVVAKATTNEKGVFELSIPTTGGSQRGAAAKGTKKRAAADEPLSLRLQISDRQKKILYRDKEVFQPTSGSLSFQEIVVSEGPEPTKASRKKRSK